MKLNLTEKIADYLGGFFNSAEAGIDAKIVVLRNAPLDVSVVVIVVLTAFIGVLDLFDRFFNGYIFGFSYTLSALVKVAVNEYFHKLGALGKQIIRASSYDNARSFVRYIADDLRLS